MARDFNGTGQYLENAVVPISSYPFTFFAKCRTTAGTEEVILGVSDFSENGEYFELSVVDSGGTNRATMAARNTTQFRLQGTTEVVDNVWVNIVGVFRGAQDREIYLNGISEGTDVTNSVTFPSALDTVTIGQMQRTGPDFGDFNGQIHDVGIADVSWTVPEIVAFSKGVSPLKLRGLVGYWPLHSDGPLGDFSSAGNNLTNISTTATTEHPIAGRYVNHPSPHAERRVRSTDDALILDRITPS